MKTILKLLLAWGSRPKQLKTCKKDINKELIPVKWHPTRWWD